MNFAFVVAFCLLAACGAVARAAAGHAFNKHESFAYGTLLANAAGCFVIGVVHQHSPTLVTLIGTAFCGALTTYSSFVRDTLALGELRNS